MVIIFAASIVLFKFTWMMSVLVRISKSIELFEFHLRFICKEVDSHSKIKKYYERKIYAGSRKSGSERYEQ